MPKKPSNPRLPKTDFPLEVVRKQVKYCTIRIKRDGTVSVTVPLSMHDEDWIAFFEKKRPWIEKHLNALPERPVHQFEPGETHYLLGKPVHVLLMPGFVDGARKYKDTIHLTYKNWNAKPETVVTNYWAKELAGVLNKLIPKWSRKMKVQPTSVRISATRSRWGSCNVKTGALQFSLELSAKPIDCIESVVVHELNHLLEPSHNDHFHQLMDHWLPDWKERKKKLNEFPREFY